MPALCQALSKGVPPVPSYAKEGAGVVLPEAHFCNSATDIKKADSCANAHEPALRNAEHCEPQKNITSLHISCHSRCRFP